MDPSGPAINLRVAIPVMIGGIPLVSSAQQYGAPSSGGGTMLSGLSLPANVRKYFTIGHPLQEL